MSSEVKLGRGASRRRQEEDAANENRMTTSIQGEQPCGVDRAGVEPLELRVAAASELDTCGASAAFAVRVIVKCEALATNFGGLVLGYNCVKMKTHTPRKPVVASSV